ncbi:MAG: hypothetical protein AB2598_20220 [Candidatus Thiodiazotropha sp.]
MDIVRQEAQVISIHHEDETPLAGVDYELTMVGADRPYQSGRTDTGGRVVFLPGTARQWRLRVFTEDGHGLDRHFELESEPVPQGQAGQGLADISKLVLGVGILLSGFGIAILFVGRNKP